MESKLSSRMNEIEFSGIRKVLEKVTRMEKQGIEVIHFQMGRPDFDTPGNVKEAAKKALDSGFVHYTSNYGLYELRESIAAKLKRENNCDYTAENIIVTIGANEAIFLAMMAVLDPGDEVIVPTPAWQHYHYCAKLVGAVPVQMKLKEENGFLPKPEELESLITPRTKMVVINSPHNPTGAVYPSGLMKQLARVAEKHQIFVLSDEIYERIIFDGIKNTSMASLSGMKGRTITINGFSKIFSMTGWRLGYVAAESFLIEPMIKAHQYTVVCNCSFTQKGGIEALEGPQDSVSYMVDEFSRRRDLVVQGLKDIGLNFCKPQGAFYIFPRIDQYGLSSQELCDYLLEDARIAVVPGHCFGDNGEAYIRMAYANSYENISRGLERMGKSLQKLGQSQPYQK